MGVGLRLTLLILFYNRIGALRVIHAFSSYIASRLLTAKVYTSGPAGQGGFDSVFVRRIYDVLSPSTFGVATRRIRNHLNHWVALLAKLPVANPSRCEPDRRHLGTSYCCRSCWSRLRAYPGLPS